jgi:uncharacterized protein (TIGR00252 family)
MTNVAHGQRSEEVAAAYLHDLGYAIIDRNWRTKWCEIDIVARYQNSLYFVEVKYRHSSAYGNGLDYITPQKLQRMSRAAESWVQAHHWPGDYRLSAIEVSGGQFVVSAWLPDL